MGWADGSGHFVCCRDPWVFEKIHSILQTQALVNEKPMGLKVDPIASPANAEKGVMVPWKRERVLLMTPATCDARGFRNQLIASGRYDMMIGC